MCLFDFITSIVNVAILPHNEAYEMSGLGRDGAFKQFIRPNVYGWRSDYDALAARLEAIMCSYGVGACGRIGDERYEVDHRMFVWNTGCHTK
jgi:hypothetical protein